MFIIADIGGTNTRIAASRDLTRFDEPIIFDTTPSYGNGLAALIERTQHLAQSEPIQAAAFGVTGVRSSDGRTIISNRHIDWEGRQLAQDLESALGCKVYLENDTALVGLGEAVHGAGGAAAIVVYVTVSTGVNGARIVDGVIDRSAFGFEIGGQYIVGGEHPQTLEDLVSGASIQARYGKHPKELGHDSPVWEELAEALAYGLNNTILHWSPHRVVLGGSMFNEIGIKVDRVQAHLTTIMRKFPVLPELVHSKLGDLGGLYGALALLKQRG